MMLNEGVADRIARIIIGGVLVGTVLFGPRTLWGLIGFVPLMTGLIGYCPMYTLFGVSTHRSSSGRGARLTQN